MATRLTLHAIGNAHIDPVWLWRWPEGLETIRATFRSALDLMREYDDFRFTCSSSAFYAMLEDVEPALLDEIRERVHEGRWELVGGWWVEPDANVPSGESLVRQGLYGQLCLQRLFGRMARIGYNPDTFGHPGGLPQILTTLGLSSYVFMRPGPHEKDLPEHVFRWRSPDGSEVIACRIARSYATWGEDVGEHVRACAREAPGSLKDYVVFYGVGNHGGGPTRRNIESLHALASSEDGVQVRLSTLEAFFERVRNDLTAGAELPVVADELQYHARGCYSAHAGVKRGNRRVEHLLLAAERLATAAHLLCGYRYPLEGLRQAWETLLFTQFHDVLAGTSIPEAYEDARDMQGYAAWIGSRTLYEAGHALARAMRTEGPGSAMVLINTLPWPVRTPVEVERGPAGLIRRDGTPVATQSVQPSSTAGQRRICFLADLPALGCLTLFGTDGEPQTASEGPLEASAGLVANRWWEVALGKSGLPDRLYDRSHGVDVLDAPGMRLAVLDDPSDTWSHGIAAFRHEVGQFVAQGEVIIEETGSVRACLRTRLAWEQSVAEHRLYLYRDIPLIEGELRLDWRGRRKALKLCIPTRIEGDHAVYETPYGVTVRPRDGEEQPGQQWVDLAGRARLSDGTETPYGLALLNDGCCGFDALGTELRMTLLRSPVYAHHDPAQLEEGVSYRYMDQGEHVFRYRLVPHVGTWADACIPRMAVEFNCGPIWANEYAHPGRLGDTVSFCSVEPAGIICLVAKMAEEGDHWILRAWETSGKAALARFTSEAMNTSWEHRFGPYELVTFRISLEGEVRVVNALEQAVPAT